MTSVLLVSLLLLANPARVQVESRTNVAGEVRGIVVDERGTPVSGAKVVFSFEQNVVTAQSGADGRFTATRVGTGLHGTWLVVKATGFAELQHRFDEATMTGMVLRLRLGAVKKLSGVIDARDARGGRVVVRERPPTEVAAEKWRDAAPVLADGTLGPDGTFSFEVAEGDYELTWERPEGVAFHALVHAPASALRLKPSKRELVGQVLDAAGAPIPGAEVAVTSVALVRTDNAGRFVIRGLSEGEYRLDFTHAGICRSHTVKVGSSANKVMLRFTGERALRGQVLAPDGTPAPRMSVLAVPLGDNDLCGMRQADTDAEGRFTLTELDDRTLELVVGVRDSVKLEARPDAGVLTIRLPETLAARTVSGVVLDAERKPIAGAMVGNERDFTDEQGRYTLRRPAGPATKLSFYKRCFVRREVAEADATEVVMARRPCLSVNVVDANKKPISGMHALQVQRADGQIIGRCTTRASEGDCTLEAELGALVVSGTLQDGRKVTTKVSLTGNDKRDVWLTP